MKFRSEADLFHGANVPRYPRNRIAQHVDEVVIQIESFINYRTNILRLVEFIVKATVTIALTEVEQWVSRELFIIVHRRASPVIKTIV